MNRFILWSGLNFLLFVSISAQGDTIYLNRADCENFFVGGGAKMNIFVNGDASDNSYVWRNPTLGANVFAGKWFNCFFGGRITLEIGTLHPYFQKRTITMDEDFALARMDVLFNVSNCICPSKCCSRSFYSLIPYMGIGGISVFNARNRSDHADSSSSFLVGGGLLNKFRLSYNLSTFLNVGLDMVNTSVDGSKGLIRLNGIAASSIGVIVDF